MRAEPVHRDRGDDVDRTLAVQHGCDAPPDRFVQEVRDHDVPLEHLVERDVHAARRARQSHPCRNSRQ
eukprot:5536943-Heterocapsa_arctica.AAC.1